MIGFDLTEEQTELKALGAQMSRKMRSSARPRIRRA